jgi:putative endonuclease
LQMNGYYVYIVASKRNGTLYIGATSDLKRRVLEHKSGDGDRFTAKYGVDKLVYFERFDSIEIAVEREKRIKKWNRQWKLDLIERANPCWKDLLDSDCYE